jgi:hypothetical protein
MSTSRTLRDPDGMLTMSASPRFIRHRGGVVWRGALFTQLCPAPSGVVDHAHDLYCLRRTRTVDRRRTKSQLTWDHVPAGSWPLWRPGDGQRGEWRGLGVRQLLFVSPALIEEVLGGRLPASEVERWRLPELVPIVQRLLDAMAADLAAAARVVRWWATAWSPRCARRCSSRRHAFHRPAHLRVAFACACSIASSTILARLWRDA